MSDEPETINTRCTFAPVAGTYQIHTGILHNVVGDDPGLVLLGAALVLGLVGLCVFAGVTGAANDPAFWVAAVVALVVSAAH